MRHIGRSLLSVGLLVPFTIVLAGGPPAAAAQPATAYRFIDLGTLGGESSYATAINDRGHVVGSSQTSAGIWHGFLWRGGRMIDLGNLRPTGINDRDEIIGTLDIATTAYPVAVGSAPQPGHPRGILQLPDRHQ